MPLDVTDQLCPHGIYVRDVCVQCDAEKATLTADLVEVNAKFPTHGDWHIDAKLAGSAPAVISREMIAWFKEKGGVNYVEMKMLDPTDRQMYVMTLQRCEGKTPHELRLEAEAKLAALDGPDPMPLCPVCGKDAPVRAWCSTACEEADRPAPKE